MDSMATLMETAGLPISEAEAERIEQYYVANSPERLRQIPDDYGEPVLDFRRTSIGTIQLEERPQVTGVRFTDLDGDGAEDDIVVTDNNLGAVTWVRLVDGNWRETRLAEIPAPVQAKPLDFDGDGDTDLAVSALGLMHPNDMLIGEFHLLLNNGDGAFEQRQLVEGVPRISESAPADFDGDGDIDFVVAMFGWRDTGGIGLLEQKDDGEFQMKILLHINGCMCVRTNDINSDGRPDFMVMLAQQHESIVQFINRGGLEFETKVITRGNNPAFGSSSIELHDLDGDGDEDILYTNGDMMDENAEPKPYHGVRWLENDGLGNYTLHYLAGMPGCYDAVPADMDGDGDLDVVFSSLNFTWKENDFPSLAWLENLGGFEEFVRRRLAYSPTNLPKIALGDADGNGKLDIIAGGMHVPGPLDRKGRLTLWLGQ